MKVYIAASWLRRSKMRRIAKQLNKVGFEVTSRWLYEPKEMTQREAAEQDLEDIDRADSLIFFSETSSAGYMTGGRHVEFGYALAKGKPIYVIGGHENVFHHLVSSFLHFSNFQIFKKTVILNEM